MKIILVTGGAGYIGSVVVKNLILEGGYKVIIFDNFSQGHLCNVDPKAICVKGDLQNIKDVDTAFSTYRPDAVIHFASNTLVGESMHEPFLYLRNNITNALNLLETAVKYKVKAFVFSSTSNLFGNPEKIPIDEKERIIPGSPYGESKFIVERFLHWMDKIYGMKYICLRYFNACGATENCGEKHNPETHLIPLILKVAKGEREKITIYGDTYDTPDGTCIRDYVHVEDLSSAHILSLKKLLASDSKSATYNIGNGMGFSVKEVLEMARKVTGHEIPCTIGEKRPGDPAILIASSENFKRDVGWVPMHSDLKNIIESAWKWN